MEEVLDALTTKHATFRRGEVTVEVCRQVMARTAGDAAARAEALTGQVLAATSVVPLEPGHPVEGLGERRASDGRSTFTRAGEARFSVDAVLAEELALAERAEAGMNAGAGVASSEAVAAALYAHHRAHPQAPLGVDQRRAVPCSPATASGSAC